MNLLLASSVTAFGIVYFLVPTVIRIALLKNLCDQPNERSAHKVITPSLGGVGIFMGFIFSLLFWIPEASLLIRYLMCATVVIFLVGLKDDILMSSPFEKLIGQLIAVGILVFLGGVRITSFGPMFLGGHLPDFLSYSLTLLFMLTIINGFNLIDGINGLAAGITLLSSSIFGIWFFLADFTGHAIVCMVLLGSVLAFFRYNITPAKIFLGDTGSLLIGLISSWLFVQFVELQNQVLAPLFSFENPLLVAICILILPLLDTVRVFVLRIAKGKSPFRPDRTHLHHLMIDMGFNHLQATSILVLVNALFVLLAILFQGFNFFVGFFAITSVAIVFCVVVNHLSEAYQKGKRVEGLLTMSQKIKVKSSKLIARKEKPYSKKEQIEL